MTDTRGGKRAGQLLSIVTTLLLLMLATQTYIRIAVSLPDIDSPSTVIVNISEEQRRSESVLSGKTLSDGNQVASNVVYLPSLSIYFEDLQDPNDISCRIFGRFDLGDDGIIEQEYSMILDMNGNPMQYIVRSVEEKDLDYVIISTYAAGKITSKTRDALGDGNLMGPDDYQYRYVYVDNALRNISTTYYDGEREIVDHKNLEYDGDILRGVEYLGNGIVRGRVNYKYSSNQLAREEFYDESGELVVVTVYTWSNGKISQTRVRSLGDEDLISSYRYDQAGNLVYEGRHEEHSLFEYDRSNRLTRAQYVVSSTVESAGLYSYDREGFLQEVYKENIAGYRYRVLFDRYGTCDRLPQFDSPCTHPATCPFLGPDRRYLRQ